jgi:signal transduction histidine kinase
VVNAIDATEEKPERIVTIRLGHQAAKEDRIDFTITVEDNGAGIDEADFDRIFSLFESTKGNRGTGLGLPVTQKIIREHGGDLRVESVLGQGTTFSIHLPCPQTPQAAAPVSPPTSPPAEG